MSENDIDVSYLDRYKNAIVLSVGDPIACNSERLKRFLITPRLVIDWEMLKDSFPECTAEHTVQTICSYFSNHDHSRPIRRVLFLASSYGNTMGPAGACLHEVASAMKADGVQVHILGVQETGEPKEEIIAGFDIHRIKNSPRNRARLFLIKNHSGPKGKLAWFLRRLSGIQKLMLLPFFPMDQPLLCRKYARTAEKLINQYDIDLVVSMYHPFEALWAGAAIAKKLNTRLCLYCVDTLTDSNPQRIYLLSKEFRDRHGWVWEKKFFSRSDLILNFKCHEKNFQDKKYECWKDKMRIVDVPLLLDRIQDS
jgi:glycosyltransferase involved in cell wall biosynthesis